MSPASPTKLFPVKHRYVMRRLEQLSDEKVFTDVRALSKIFLTTSSRRKLGRPEEQARRLPELAVNLAGSMAMFLVSAWSARKSAPKDYHRRSRPTRGRNGRWQLSRHGGARGRCSLLASRCWRAPGPTRRRGAAGCDRSGTMHVDKSRWGLATRMVQAVSLGHA